MGSSWSLCSDNSTECPDSNNYCCNYNDPFGKGTSCCSYGDPNAPKPNSSLWDASTGEKLLKSWWFWAAIIAFISLVGTTIVYFVVIRPRQKRRAEEQKVAPTMPAQQQVVYYAQQPYPQPVQGGAQPQQVYTGNAAQVTPQQIAPQYNPPTKDTPTENV